MQSHTGLGQNGKTLISESSQPSVKKLACATFVHNLVVNHVSGINNAFVWSPAGIAVMMQSDYYGAYCYIMVDLIEQSWRSAILFASAGCFQKVLTTEVRHANTHALKK
jgi:hypothetical protein